MSNEALQKQETEVSRTSQSNQYTFTPKCGIWETADNVLLEVELPGVDEKGVDVKLEDGVLTILGEVTKHEVDGYSRSYAEYETGNFERSFRITEEIDADKIAATIRNGLLTLSLPKREAVKPKRISVKIG